LELSTRSVEDLFHEIGREAVAISGDDLAGKLLVYAEVEDGVISADLLYQTPKCDGPDGYYEPWVEAPDP
jgi:hypothetical protein